MILISAVFVAIVNSNSVSEAKWNYNQKQQIYDQILTSNDDSGLVYAQDQVDRALLDLQKAMMNQDGGPRKPGKVSNIQMKEQTESDYSLSDDDTEDISEKYLRDDFYPYEKKPDKQKKDDFYVDDSDEIKNHPFYQ